MFHTHYRLSGEDSGWGKRQSSDILLKQIVGRHEKLWKYYEFDIWKSELLKRPRKKDQARVEEPERSVRVGVWWAPEIVFKDPTWNDSIWYIVVAKIKINNIKHGSRACSYMHIHVHTCKKLDVKIISTIRLKWKRNFNFLLKAKICPNAVSETFWLLKISI